MDVIDVATKEVAWGDVFDGSHVLGLDCLHLCCRRSAARTTSRGRFLRQALPCMLEIGPGLRWTILLIVEACAIMQEEAAQHAAEVFGLAGIDATKVKEFVSYDDRNFYLPAVTYSHPETKQTEVLDVIFKVHNGVESDNDGLIRAHNEVLAYLKNEGVMVPEPLPVRQGGDTIGWISLKRIRNEADSRKHAVRLLRYIPGVLIDQNEKEKPEMLQDLGRFVGRMDNKLLQLAMPKGLEGRVLLWDLKNLPALARFSDCIVDPANRALQTKVSSIVA